MDGERVAVFREKDDGASIVFRIGDTFEVRLLEAATAGYRWRVGEWDRSVIAVRRLEPGAPVALAVGGKREAAWALECLGAGGVEVQLAYGRAWESASTRTFRLHVTVEASGMP